MTAPAEPSFAWRPRAYLLLGAAAVLFVLGIAEGSPVPILVALPLLLAPIAAPILTGRNTPEARVAGQLRGSGGAIELRYTAAPNPPFHPADLQVRLPPPAGVEQRAPPRYSVADGQLVLDLAWSVPAPTVAAVPPPEIQWEDPMGLVARPTGATGEPVVIERYPPELQRSGVVRLAHTIPLPGETRSRAVGSTGEFYGIREAIPLDPPRLINWLATARVGRRLANEFALERTGDLLILIDARPTSLGRSVDSHLLGISRAAAYGLADAFLREKTRVGVAVYGEFLTAVPLGSGRTHRLRIHDLLIAASLANTGGPAERGAISVRRLYVRGVTTLLLSSLADEESLLLVPHLARRGFRPIVLSPSYLPIVATLSGLDPESEAAVARIGRLYRREQIARTWEHAPAIDWADYWSLAGFVDFLKRPSLRERGT